MSVLICIVQDNELNWVEILCRYKYIETSLGWIANTCTTFNCLECSHFKLVQTSWHQWWCGHSSQQSLNSSGDTGFSLTWCKHRNTEQGHFVEEGSNNKDRGEEFDGECCKGAVRGIAECLEGCRHRAGQQQRGGSVEERKKRLSRELNIRGFGWDKWKIPHGWVADCEPGLLRGCDDDTPPDLDLSHPPIFVLVCE